MIKTKSHILFIACMLIICLGCDQTKRKKEIVLEKIDPEVLICNLMHTKKLFMESSQSNYDSTKNLFIESWTQIQQHRSKVLLYLIDFRNDSSFSLYCGYEHEFTLKKLPNFEHALYLIEATIRNDYLFNRRCHNQLSVQNYFINDRLNFLTYRKKLEGVGGFDQVQTNFFSPNNLVDTSYMLYREYIRSERFPNSTVSPLQFTNIVWNDFSYNRMNEKLLSERMISIRSYNFYNERLKLSFLMNKLNPQ